MRAKGKGKGVRALVSSILGREVSAAEVGQGKPKRKRAKKTAKKAAAKRTHHRAPKRKTAKRTHHRAPKRKTAKRTHHRAPKRKTAKRRSHRAPKRKTAKRLSTKAAIKRIIARGQAAALRVVHARERENAFLGSPAFEGTAPMVVVTPSGEAIPYAPKARGRDIRARRDPDDMFVD